MVKLRHLLSAILICSILLIGCAFAQSSLTQIRDTIVNPDGTLFSGTVVITWNGYAGSGGGTVSRLSASAQIYNGALSVLLVPTTTAASGTYYQVVYSSSDGTVTWSEVWQVPPSTTPLTVSQVRQSSTEGSGSGNSNGSGGSNPQYATLPISISEITNLSSDLSSINNSISTLSSQLTSLTGTVNTDTTNLTSLTNTVNTNGTTLSNLSSTVNSLSTTVSGHTTSISNLQSGLNTVNSTLTTDGSTLNTLGANVTTLTNTVNTLSATVNSLSAGSSAVFVDSEAPSGTLNGTNTTFTLANTPSPAASLMLFRNGLEQPSGVAYTLSGATVTFTSGSIPQSGDIIQAYYRMAGNGPTASFADSETPGGTTNGSNLAFTLVTAPNPASSLKLYKNGVLLKQSADYTLSGSTITFSSTSTTPQTGDSLLAFYRH